MTQSEFKWKHFTPEVTLWSLRWYGTTTLSYAYVSDIRSTIYRCFFEFVPKLCKKLRRYQYYAMSLSNGGVSN